MALHLLRALNVPILGPLRNALTCNRFVLGKAQFHLQASRRASTQTDGPFKYRLALPPDYENVVCFMNHAYLKHDPAMSAIGLANAPSFGSLLNILGSQIEAGMTIIALNPDDCLVGAAVNVVSCPWDGRKAQEYARCCETGLVREVLEFFAYVTSKPDLWRMYGVYTIFECTSIAVDPSARCRGIARRLIEESWVLARDCGYPLFRIDCTSKYTAKIAENFNWQKVLTLPYCRYVKDGELVFKDIQEPHTEVQVYVDTLRHYKTYYPPYKGRKVCAKKSQK